MANCQLHGFVVQNSAIYLDLSTSNNYTPVSFIISEKSYNTAVQEITDRYLAYGLLPARTRNIPVTYWEYFDSDRESFEENIFLKYEKNVLESQFTSIHQLRNYLKLSLLMGRCCELEEAERIYALARKFLFKDDDRDSPVDSSVVVELLKTVCSTYDGLFLILRKLGSDDNLQHLDHLLFHVRRMKFNVWGLWPGISGILTDYNLVDSYLNQGNFNAVLVLLQHGIHPGYSEDVFNENCERFLNVSWIEGHNTETNNMLNHMSKERLHLVLQICAVLNDWRATRSDHCLEALVQVWRAIPDPFITESELSTTILSSASFSMRLDLPNICNAYRTIRPRCAKTLRPRSLRHLSRCVVRRRQTENFQLPEGIVDLKDVPPYLQEYLMLKL